MELQEMLLKSVLGLFDGVWYGVAVGASEGVGIGSAVGFGVEEGATIGVAVGFAGTATA